MTNYIKVQFRGQDGTKHATAFLASERVVDYAIFNGRMYTLNEYDPPFTCIYYEMDGFEDITQDLHVTNPTSGETT